MQTLRQISLKDWVRRGQPVDDSDTSLRAKWDARYRERERPTQAALVLRENLHLLPTAGRALDLACGLGGNALLLAEQGLQVDAWDLSPVAIEQLQQEAVARNLRINAQVRDIVEYPPTAESYDVVTVSHFLDRTLIPVIKCSLTPKGLVFYQTFIRDAARDTGPSNPTFRLGQNELLALFEDLILRVYREEGSIGDVSSGIRDLALLVAQKC